MVEFFICSKMELFECKSGKVVNKLECYKIFNKTTEIEQNRISTFIIPYSILHIIRALCVNVLGVERIVSVKKIL